jgi:YfiH family protein
MVAGPARGAEVAGPSRAVPAAGPSRAAEVAGPSRGAEVAGPSRAVPTVGTLPAIAAGDPAVALAFSGRADGNLSLVVGARAGVAEARRRLLARVGASLDDAVFMQQVHGARTVVVGRDYRGRGVADHAHAVAGADALVTFDPGVALVVLVADCVPLLLVDPGRGVAAVHAGRRGLEAGIVERALALLAPRTVERVVAVIGPAVGGCCYEVPTELAERVAEAYPSARATTRWGSPSLDLPAAAAHTLADAGVARVERSGGCTRCDDAAWFSHRATTTSGTPAGRQAGVVVRHLHGLDAGPS